MFQRRLFLGTQLHCY